jgi:predicted negative regulator of RcsB-dependent stress response
MPDEALITAAEVEPLAFLLVVIVVLFLGYLVRRDKQQNETTKAFMEYLEVQRDSNTQNMNQVTAALQALHGDLRNLDTYLRASLEAMQKAKTRTARTRKDDA